MPIARVRAASRGERPRDVSLMKLPLLVRRDEATVRATGPVTVEAIGKLFYRYRAPAILNVYACRCGSVALIPAGASTSSTITSFKGRRGTIAYSASDFAVRNASTRAYPAGGVST